MEEVEQAARAANAFDFISALPEGFNTLVGERGMQVWAGGVGRRCGQEVWACRCGQEVWMDVYHLKQMYGHMLNHALSRTKVGTKRLTVQSKRDIAE